MATLYAFTDIDHGMGSDENGNPIVLHFDAGQPVKGLDDATIKALTEAGALCTYNRLEVEAAGGGDAAAAALAIQKAELETENESLRAKLAEMEAAAAEAAAGKK